MAKLIGTAPNQVPSNADLGNMAYQNTDGVRIKSGKIDELVGIPKANNDLPAFKPSLMLDFVNSPHLDSRFDFTRYSKAAYYDEEGYIKYANINEPRFSHDPETGECLGLYVERPSTNLCPRSDTPFPLNLADSRVVEDAALDGGDALLFYLPEAGSGRAGARNRDAGGWNWGNISADTAGWITHSCYLKPVNWSARTYTHWDDSSDSGYPGAGITYTLPTDGSTVLKTGFTAYGPFFVRAEHIVDDWWRSSVTFYHPTGVSRNIIMMGTVSGQTYSGGESSYFWGMQTEYETFATSYIKTLDTPLTRGVDLVKMNSEEFLKTYNRDAVTFIVDDQPAGDQVIDKGWGHNNFIASIGTSGSNYIGLGYMGQDKQAPYSAQTYLRNDTNSTFTWYTFDVLKGAIGEDEDYSIRMHGNNKYGMSGDDSEWYSAINGRSLNKYSYSVNDHNGLPSIGSNFTLFLGGNHFNSTTGTYRYIRKVTVYKKKVTKQQLKALTER